MMMMNFAVFFMFLLMAPTDIILNYYFKLCVLKEVVSPIAQIISSQKCCLKPLYYLINPLHYI